MPRGGKRPGAGRPKGTTGIKQKATLSKEAAREALRVIVMREMDEMSAAQIAAAKGLKYLVARHKKGGTFRPVRNVLEAIKDEEQIIEVWEHRPSTQAFTDLMNRALDKPKEQMQEIEVHGLEGLAERLARGRERAGE
jgi:hypothetical protein